MENSGKKSLQDNLSVCSEIDQANLVSISMVKVNEFKLEPQKKTLVGKKSMYG